MPKYTLQVEQNGVITPTDYTLQITGSAASRVKLKYSTTGSGPWTQYTGQISFKPGSRHGSPASPKPGDVLSLNGTIGPYSVEGPCTYDPPGQNGKGYFAVSVKEEDTDWSAKAN